MTIEWMDGPDHYGVGGVGQTNTATVYAGPLQISANAGPGGVGNAIYIPGGAVRKVRPAYRFEIGVGQRVFFEGLPSRGDGADILDLLDSVNSYIGGAFILPTGAIRVQMSDGTIIYETLPVLVAQSWQHVEIYFKADTGLDGTLRINVDSLPIVNLDGIQTTKNANPIAIWGMSQTNNGAVWLNRDIYTWNTLGAVNNSGMQGDRQVLTSFPNDDGPEQDWAYSAGASGWPLISNNPPDDTQFVYSTTAGDLSDFAMEDVDTEITSISAIRLAARAWKSDAGIGTLSLGVVSSGSKSTVVEQALSTEKVYYSQIIELDPHTDARFSPTSLNAALAELNRVQ